MATSNRLEVTVIPQSYFTSAEKAIARQNIGALGVNEYNFDVAVSTTNELRSALLNPNVHFIYVDTENCKINSNYANPVQGVKYIYGKKIIFEFDSFFIGSNKIFFLNETCQNTDDSDYTGNIFDTSVDAGVYINNLINDGWHGINKGNTSLGTYVYQTMSGPSTNFTQSDWVTPELENYNRIEYSFDTLNNLYDTVSSNSANWDNSGIQDVTTSGSYLRTSAGWSEYNEPDPCTLCSENFVEWNFNRQSTDAMVAHPIMALSDTSGTPSATLNAGDKYMIYVDGLLGQSGTNNTFVNFGIQSGTVTGQYLSAINLLPSKKLCRSTSTGNDFACAYMFTVPTNGSYSVAIQPTQNNQEYKFFGNTTIRQIKIG